MKKLEIAGFGGVNTSLDPRLISDTASQNQLNVRVEGGTLRPRYGYKNLALPQSGFTSVWGFRYLQGFSGTTENEEYVSAETKSGNTRFYSRNVSTAVATEITNGGASINVNGSEWVFAPYAGDSYFINPANSVPVYRHTIGTITSLTAIAVPAAPTVLATYAVSYGPGGTTDYTQLSWAGLDPTSSGELLCTGAATNTGSALNADNTFSVRHTNSQIESTFEVDMNDITAGVQDWTYNDRFRFSTRCETSQFNIQVNKVELRNNEGSPITLVPDIFNIIRVEGAGGAGFTYAIAFGWTDKTRADFDNVRYFKLYYTVTKSSSTVANNDLIISKLTIGGVDMSVPTDTTPEPDGLEIGYSYYFSTPQFESEVSPALFIPNEILNGQLSSIQLGVQISLTLTASGDANVDNFRIYARKAGTETWYRLATQVDSDTTYDLRITYIEITRLTEYESSPFTLASATAACSYKGSLVWFYNTGTDNVRFSRVGDPLKQASTEDTSNDDNRGRTMTLADNAADIPLGGIQAGDAVMIAGKYGVYVTFGDFPAQMTFIRKVSGSFGVAGKYAFCRWKTDNGLSGMAYVSRDGQIYFAFPGGPNVDEPGDNILLTSAIRDGALSLRTFFIDEQPDFGFTDFSTAQIVSDDQQESLMIAMGNRMLVFRRPDYNGSRDWEPAEYNLGDGTISLRYLDGSTKRRVRGIRSSGHVDEFEFNSSTGAFIDGDNRDGGNAIESLFWQSKAYVGANSRTGIARVYRDDLSDAPTVTDHTTRTPLGASSQVPSGAVGIRLPPSAQGTEHSFRIDIEENASPIRRIEIELTEIPSRRGN